MTNRLARAATMPNEAAKFWSKVDQREPDECWPWLAGCSPKGYGQFMVRRGGRYQMFRAHRYALAASGAAVPAGAVVMHRCDNPPCCNPAHLKVGTSKDNNHDMLQKGRARHFKGSETKNAKLTEDQVREVRAAPGPLAAIGRQFGISMSTVSRIRTRKLWVHLP